MTTPEVPPALVGDGITDDSKAASWYADHGLPLPPPPAGGGYLLRASVLARFGPGATGQSAPRAVAPQAQTRTDTRRIDSPASRASGLPQSGQGMVSGPRALGSIGQSPPAPSGCFSHVRCPGTTYSSSLTVSNRIGSRCGMVPRAVGDCPIFTVTQKLWRRTVSGHRLPIMPKKSSKPLPADANQRAAAIAALATGEDVARAPEKNAAAVALGRLGGQKGGAARAAALTPERRSEIARLAAAKRHGKD